MEAEKVLKNLVDNVEKKEDGYWADFSSGDINELMESLRDSGVYRIITISGVDVGEDIEIIYHAESEGEAINLRTRVPKGNPEIETITKIFPGAELYEREVMEMLGVNMRNHPNPKRLFLAKDSPKTPLRRD